MTRYGNNRPFSKEWDEELKSYLTDECSLRESTYTVYLTKPTSRLFFFLKRSKTIEVWVGSRGGSMHTSFGTLYSLGGSHRALDEYSPSKETLDKLAEKLSLK